MAYSRITSGIAAAATFVSDATITGANTTGADLILLFVTQLTGVATPTDNKSNTWTPLTGYGSTVSAGWYYCQNPTVGSGHNFTEAYNGNGAAGIGMLAYSGSVSTPLDQQNGGSTSSGTSQATGSVTPSESNELVVSALAYNTAQSSPPTVDVGAIVTSILPVAGASFGMSLAEQIQTTATARNATWTGDTACFLTVAIATFKDTPSGATGWGPLLGLQNNRLVVSQ